MCAPLHCGVLLAGPGCLVPASPDLFDAVLRLPIDGLRPRAHGELGWEPRYTSVEALQEFFAGLRAGAGMDTPPLAAHGTACRPRG